MMQKVRIAVVGVGGITKEYFFPAVAVSQDSQLEAIFTGSPERSGPVARKYGCDHVLPYEDYEEAIGSDLFDAVYIAVPNPLHAAYATTALKAGKHVLVEKPIATTASDAEAMIAAAKEGGSILMTSYRMHTDPVAQGVIGRIRSGRIGEVRHFTSCFSFQVDAGNHRLKAGNWGGALQDIGLYCINVARQIFDVEPLECFATATRRPEDERFAEIADSASVTLVFPGMRTAQFVVSFGAAAVDQYLVVGTEGSIRVDGGLRMDTQTNVEVHGPNADTKTYEPRDQFAPLVSAFSEHIRKGTSPIGSDGTEGLKDLKVILAIESSIEKKQVIRV